MSRVETVESGKVRRTSPSNRKVLLLGKLPPPYMGPAVATRILLNSRLREMYEIVHVDTGTNDSLEAIGKWSFRKVAGTFGVYRRMVRALWRDKPDLAIVPISQSTKGFLKDSVFILLSRFSGTRTLVQLRGSDILNWLGRSPGLVRKYVRKTLGWADGAIVLGENLRYLFGPFYPASRIFVVTNGADYRFPAKKRRDSDRSFVRVLCISNLKESKGIRDVIEAASVLTRRGVANFRVDVVGAWRSEEFKAACVAEVEERRVPVVFHPPAFEEDKLRFLADADVFVFTPREPEGHPWVIVEALAAGLPIVSTDQGAIRESVLEGVNGYLVETNTPKQIADSLQQLIEDRELMSNMGSAGRRHYEEHFTEDSMVKSFASAIDAMLTNDRSSSSRHAAAANSRLEAA